MKPWRMAVFAVLTLLSSVIFLERRHTQTEPLECDTALFSVQAHEWNRGRPLYSDLWDNKPPAITLTYAFAQRAAGEGPGSLLLLEVSFAILTLFGLYQAAFWMTGKQSAGLWAAAFWTLVNATPYLEANLPNAEVFVNACWIWGLAWAFRIRQTSESSRDPWIADASWRWPVFTSIIS